MIKVDLHLHSVASNKPAGYLSRKLGINESYTKPLELYYTLKKRGMTLFTITDHDSIEGCLEIAHLPGTFISEEITTYFPEDGCKVHVIVIDINEKIHEDIQRIRENIYDLVDYLQEKNIIHILAHPLYDINGKLEPKHIEKFLLLFDNWEILNGTRSKLASKLTMEIINKYTKEDILRLANKYGFLKRKRDFISFTGGSDDHGGLDAGSAYTYVEKGETVEDLKRALNEGRTIPKGEYGSPKKIAHMVGKVIYEGCQKRYSIFSSFLRSTKMNNLIISYIITQSDAERKEDLHGKIYNFFKDLLPYQIKNLREWKNFDFQKISQFLGMGIFSLIPMCLYIAIYWHKARDNFKSQKIYSELIGNSYNEGKIACFTDTFFEINGVAKTYQGILEVAKKYNLNLRFILSYPKETNDPFIKNFKPLVSFPLPEYNELTVSIPNFLEVLEYIENEKFEVIYSATPGVMGIYALLISKILGLPFVTTFHTDLPEYIKRYTEEPLAYEYSWKLLSLFYNSASRILSPSIHCKELLMEKGVDGSKIVVFKRGINLELFNPEKREDNFWFRYDKNYKGEKIILYVGRIAKEKDLEVFIDVAKLFNEDGVKFAIVGDGPYRQKVEELARNRTKNIIFTGFLEGEPLAKAYASSYLFLFPSTTETFGNVVLEAQASGLPVLVSDKGAVKEQVIHGVNGFIVRDNNVNEYYHFIERLIKDKKMYENMRNNAIKMAKELDYEKLILDMMNKLSLGLINIGGGSCLRYWISPIFTAKELAVG